MKHTLISLSDKYFLGLTATKDYPSAHVRRIDSSFTQLRKRLKRTACVQENYPKQRQTLVELYSRPNSRALRIRMP